jgi:hypothetical protein
MSMSQEETAVDAITAFMVVLNKNGGVDVHVNNMPTLNIDRTADLVDIEAASARLVAESGRMLMLRAMAQPTDVTPAAVVAEALAKRVEK